jgi:WD40 repeat protein
MAFAGYAVSQPVLGRKDVVDGRSQEAIILGKHRRPVIRIAFSQDGSKLASTSLDDTAIIWDITGRRQLHSLKLPSWGYGVSFSPDGMVLATGSTENLNLEEVYGIVVLWDTMNGKKIETLRLEHLTSPVRAITYSADGKYLAAGSKGRRIVEMGKGKLLPGQVRLWKTKGLEEVQTWDTQESTVLDAAFSPDGSVLVSVGGDEEKPIGEILVWDVEKGKLKSALKKQKTPVYSLAFSTDGKLLITGGGLRKSLDRMQDVPEVKFWDPANGTEIGHLEGIQNRVMGVAISPDGKLLATCGGDHATDDVDELRVWDLASKKELCRLRGHEATVHAVAFSPDGKFLASGGHDGTVRLWDVKAILKK